jgi:hypothetical protein
MAIASFVLAICCILAWVIPFIGVPVCLASIVVGGITLAKKRNPIAGFLGVFLGAIFLILSLINAVLGWIMWSPEFWQWMEFWEGF